jgi:capsular polysaccharide transport system permease protein
MVPKQASLRVGLRRQLAIMRALMIRDMMSRFGRDNVGFVWVVLEPMILTVGVMTLWRVMFGQEKEGATVVEMVFSSYMPLTLWRHMTSVTALIYRRSMSLRYHRRITLLDIYLGRQALEFVATSTAALVVWVFLVMLGLTGLPHRFDLLLIGWLAMGSMALGTGALVTAATERWDAAERFIPPVQYLLIPLSGSFFLQDWVPEDARRLFLLNPLVHCYEMVRGGYWGPTIPTYYDIWYPYTWGAILIFFGILSINNVRNYIQLN